MSTFRVPWSQTWAGTSSQQPKNGVENGQGMNLEVCMSAKNDRITGLWALSIISFGHKHLSDSATKSKFCIDFPSPNVFDRKHLSNHRNARPRTASTCALVLGVVLRRVVDFNLVGIRKSTPKFLGLCCVLIRKIQCLLKIKC